MTQELKIGCQCGTVQGHLPIRTGQGMRACCHCRSCQSYAQHLGQAEAVLNEHGGTDLWQTTLGGLKITQGSEQLACLRLSPKGPVRWYARCCNTPLANTLATASPPFVAVPAVAWRDGHEAVPGPGVGIWGRYARSPKPAGVHDKVPPATLLRVVAMLLKGRLRGEHRDTAFFDAQGQPRIEPEILSREQRQAAEAALG